MTETTILYTTIVFYIAIISLLTLASFAIPETEISTKPDFPEITPTLVAASIVTLGGVFIVLIGVYIFELFTFSLTALLPVWLNTILFVPLGVVLIYIFAKLIRGN